MNPGGVPDYMSGCVANSANSPVPTDLLGTGGIRKFVDPLPNLAVAVPDKQKYPGSDYYEISVVQFSQKLHTDLPPTLLRGYVQTNSGKDENGGNITAPAPVQYLGPLIIAQKDRPVRVKFTNNLPSGTGGDLFIPVDTTVMGSGMAPNGSSYSQNRVGIHLHGGNTPWISDGTPHQWTTPASENTSYPKGVAVRDVPEMTPSAPGEMTFYYTNQQSARLMFYHDHAYGITRLNVYAGVAAGYLLQDPIEQKLVTGGTITPPNQAPVNIAAGTIPADQIPLVLQDKTFIPSPEQLAAQDPTWNWGPKDANGNFVTGNLWFPHVYMPNQNPFDESGANAMGRWDWGPWFWPPMDPSSLKAGEVPCPNDANPSQMCPGTPNPSLTPEGFMDTPVINGAAYPYVNVDPKPYRLRILNAANDRSFSLGLYCADPSVTTADGRHNTEVKMVPAVATSGFPSTWPTDGRDGGVPDPATVGPPLIQIGTEGGFLPNPVVIPSTPVNYNYNRRDIVVLNISTHGLLIGPAERADVVVDFSKAPASCSTLVLYNDAPAPVPAFDTRFDYYTGDEDETSTGGAPSTLAGYGPNTRTLMQFRLNAPGSGNAATNELGVCDGVCTALQTALPAAFAASQDVPIIPESVYGPVYGTTYKNTYSRIQDTSLFTGTVTGINVTAPGTRYTSAPAVAITSGGGSGATATATVSGGVVTGITVTNPGSGYNATPTVTLTGGGGTGATAAAVGVPMLRKTIQELFELDYGRMNATLGLEMPFTNFNTQTTIPLGYIDSPTEIMKDGEVQIWKVTHNGVDQHAIHFHLFNVQLINRVGWDGAIRPPEANEIGWKETVRMSPLEDAIVAIRPIKQNLPWPIPDSIRLQDPTSQQGATLRVTDTTTGNITSVANDLINFGQEYVWHCHLLGHEENDMMRPIVFQVAPETPSNLVATPGAHGAQLNWTDNSKSATGFTLKRATDAAFTAGIAVINIAGALPTTYLDSSLAVNTTYYYQVQAVKPCCSSAFSNTATITTLGPPAGATTVTATVINPFQVDLAWSFTDNINPATGFRIERRIGAAGAFTAIASVAPGLRAYSDTTAPDGTALNYRVIAFNTWSDGPVSNSASATTPLAPPATLAGAVTGTGPVRITLTWTDVSVSNTGFTVQRATNNTFTTGLTSFNVTPGTATTYLNNTGLVTGATYFYRVRSTRGATTSAWAATLSIATVAPAAPSGLTATATTAPSVSLAWVDNSNNESGFTIQRATDNTFTTALTTFNVAANVSSYSDTAVSAGTYFYRVRASNGIDTSAFSNTASVVVGGPSASVSPNPVPFGSAALNTTTAAQTLTLSNSGTVVLQVSSIALGGTNAADFALTNNCGASLAPATSCTMSATFKPTANGARAATITINNNSLATPSLAVPLTGTGATLATMITPAPSSTLTSNSVPFTWNAGTGITIYQLLAGTSVGASNLFSSGNVTATGVTATGLPLDGSTVYVRLQSQVNGVFQFVDYTYTAVTAVKAAITSPAPSSTLTNTSATFTWSAGVMVTQYQLSVGTSVGASDLFASGNLATTTASVSGLPFDGSPVYVRLQSQINGVWQSTDYTYTAVSPTKASMVSPVAGSTLSGTSVNLTWGGGFMVTNYQVSVGSTPGGTYDIATSGPLAPSVTSFQATVPPTGATIFVRLWSLVNGTWVFNDYLYTASGIPASKGVITSPAPNTTLVGTNITFNWTGSGSTQYMVSVGSTTPGSYDIANSGWVAPSVTSFQATVPATGANVYVRLWSTINGALEFNDYLYTASGTATLGAIASPIPNSTFLGTTVLFTWTGNGPSNYQVSVGSTPGGSFDIATSGPLGSSVNSFQATVPATGAPVYVRLWSFINNAWQFTDYGYTAFQ